ncbi:MAG: hypothetical protein AB1403_06750 [Candidatus Riflebacteria bacterium]
MKTHGRLAFSFVEIMFAVILLGILLVPIYSLFSQGSHGAIQSRNEILAQQHASNLLAFLHLFPYDHEFLTPVFKREFGRLDLVLESEALNLEPEPLFKRFLTIKEISPTNWSRKYKIITINLEWSEGQKKQELKLCGIKFK